MLLESMSAPRDPDKWRFDAKESKRTPLVCLANLPKVKFPIHAFRERYFACHCWRVRTESRKAINSSGILISRKPAQYVGCQRYKCVCLPIVALKLVTERRALHISLNGCNSKWNLSSLYILPARQSIFSGIFGDQVVMLGVTIGRRAYSFRRRNIYTSKKSNEDDVPDKKNCSAVNFVEIIMMIALPYYEHVDTRTSNRH